MSTTRFGAHFVGTDYAQNPSDSVTASDALAVDFAIALSDSVTATDTVASEAGLSLADATSVTDDLARGVGAALADAVTLADSLAVADEIVLGDSVTVTDADTEELGVARALGLDDDVTVTDDLATEATPEGPPGEGGQFYPVRRLPRRFTLALDDIALTSDAYEIAIRQDPELQREEELVLALI